MDLHPGNPMHLAFDRRRARGCTLRALAGLLLAGPAAAQAPGQGAAPWAAPPAAAAPTQASATSERATRRGLHLGLVSGGAAFSAFRSQMVTAHLLDGDGTGDTERTFERLIAPETSTAAAVLATWWFSPRWAVRLAAAYAASSLTIRLEERDRSFLENNGAGDASRYADLAVWLTEASVLVTIGALPRRVEPYLVMGAGAVLYDPDESYGEPLPVGIRAVMAEQSRRVQPALVIGTGARVALEPGPLALTFELVDHVTLSPFDRLEPAILERDGLRLEMDGDDELPGTRVINHLRFAAGVSIPLGR